jgi:hypothetical protein
MTPLSASKIKTLKGCSWKYWASYHLKVPETTNTGALSGSICHTVFECLGNPRHKKYYDQILKEKTFKTCKPVYRLVRSYCLKNGLKKPHFDEIDKMIVAGLGYDFFGKKPTEAHSELKFEIEVNEDGKKYKLLGFIDKLFLYKKNKLAVIRDFKSSKEMFKGDDKDDNYQSHIYSLAISKLYPEFLKRRSEFCFLKFMEPDDPKSGVVITEQQDNDELEGFEHYLTEVQKIVDNFTEEDAKVDLAKHKPYPTDGSFTGRLACGFDTYKGQLKKDGGKRWGCSYKWPMSFYCVRNKQKKILKTYLLDDYCKVEVDESKGEYITIEEYAGCPAWNR